MKPVGNCMISAVQLLFLKTNLGPPCSLEMEKFGCALCWMVFEKSQMYNLKKLFPVEAMVTPKSVTPFGRGLGGSAVSRPPYCLETHLLVQVTRDVKSFQSAQKNVDPTLFLVLVGIYLAEPAKLKHFFLPRKKSRGKKDGRFT